MTAMPPQQRCSATPCAASCCGPTEMAAAREWTTLAVLFVGVLLAALDIALVGPALPAIQASFAVAPRWLPAVFSVYVLLYVVGTPLLAKRSDRYGRRRVFLESLAVFGVGSLLVAAAW